MDFNKVKVEITWSDRNVGCAQEEKEKEEVNHEYRKYTKRH